MSGTMNPNVTKIVQGEKVCSSLGQSRPDHGMIRNGVLEHCRIRAPAAVFPLGSHGTVGRLLRLRGDMEARSFAGK